MNTSAKKLKPLCIDLDGTLVETDTLVELALILIKRDIRYVVRILAWLLKGRAYSKQQIASRAVLAVELLPYHPKLVQYIQEQLALGRPVHLVTASDMSVAQAVAKHLGLFSKVLASEGDVNLSGTAKAAALVREFGDKGYVYAGNAMVDLPVWRSAAEAIVVSSNKSLLALAKQAATIEQIFSGPGRNPKQWLKLIRSYQWIKNILLLVPLAAAHQITDVSKLTAALLAVAAFCLASSSVYVLNDLFDLEADRRHPKKKFRPLASGAVPLKEGIAAVPLLLVGSLVIAWFLPLSFLVFLGMYLCLTLLYSLYLKREVLVDVFLLAFLYTIRVYAGAAAVGIGVSSWLTAFALFLFLSLAMVKRFAELHRLKKEDGQQAAGRGYVVDDQIPLAQLGTVSGYLSALILALYISSVEVRTLYTTPLLLWLLVPLLLYWISRVWFLAHRGRMEEDPIIFAIKDTVSFLVGLAAIVIVITAT